MEEVRQHRHRELQEEEVAAAEELRSQREPPKGRSKTRHRHPGMPMEKQSVCWSVIIHLEPRL